MNIKHESDNDFEEYLARKDFTKIGDESTPEKDDIMIPLKYRTPKKAKIEFKLKSTKIIVSHRSLGKVEMDKVDLISQSDNVSRLSTGV